MLLLTFIFIFGSICCSTNAISVKTSSGFVEGHQVNTHDPRTGSSITYSRFPTIPFAKPPVGDLRFAPPEPLDPSEVIDTTNVTSTRMCHQMGDLFGLLSSLTDFDEDCLYLYVYVPGTWPPPKPLPVMIWFTGGAFVLGNMDPIWSYNDELKMQDLETGMVQTDGCHMMSSL